MNTFKTLFNYNDSKYLLFSRIILVRDDLQLWAPFCSPCMGMHFRRFNFDGLQFYGLVCCIIHLWVVTEVSEFDILIKSVDVLTNDLTLKFLGHSTTFTY